jgi:hypothetical protein
MRGVPGDGNNSGNFAASVSSRRLQDALMLFVGGSERLSVGGIDLCMLSRAFTSSVTGLSQITHG